LNKRIGAKLIENYVKDLTPEEEYEKERIFRKNRALSLISSSKGRPSKKQRRDLEEILGKSKDTEI
jgi:ribosome-associated heat shock protein Hsp15